MPSLKWSRNLGGYAYDSGRSGLQTDDGGYIVAGETSSFGAGGRDVFLIKTDADGSVLWNRTFGGSKDEIGYSVQQTSDGGYIVTGYRTNYLGIWDVLLIKVEGMVVDTTPPTTTLTVGNPSLLGRFVTSATPFTLNATDDTSGVDKTYYKIDGGSWIEYVGTPFTLATYPRGFHTIEYYSTDKAGNPETPKSAKVYLIKPRP